MKQPSSRYLSYQCSLFKGVTFHEFLVIAGVGTAASFVVSLILGLITGYVALSLLLGVIGGGIASLTALPRRFAKHKKGKPHGYLAKSVRLFLARHHLIENPYTTHQGAWSKSKRYRSH